MTQARHCEEHSIEAVYACVDAKSMDCCAPLTVVLAKENSIQNSVFSIQNVQEGLNSFFFVSIHWKGHGRLNKSDEGVKGGRGEGEAVERLRFKVAIEKPETF